MKRTPEPVAAGGRRYLGGVEFAVVQLQDVQGSLQVGLRLRQLQLDGPQTVGIRGGQVHPQQGQIHLKEQTQSHHEIKSARVDAAGRAGRPTPA